ncbi:hypothetical protein KC345_g8108 [Hortaea werneckii]|nr:hypothetical protein KC345_g8108 [Hortaea werneckii]
MPTNHLQTPPFQPQSPQSTNNTNIPAETGPPIRPLRGKAYNKQLQNERTAIKTHLDRFISTSFATSSSSSSSSEPDRLRILLEQRTAKLRQRADSGKRSTRALFPDFWDFDKEVEWLRKGCRGFLEGGVYGCKGGKAGLGFGGRGEEDRDDDEEVVIGVKKEEGDGEDGGEVGGVGLGSGGGRSQQVVGMEGSSLEVKMEMRGEEVEGAGIPGRMDEMDGHGKAQGKKLGRGKGKARLLNEAMVGVACSRGWAILNSSVEAVEELVDTAKTGPSGVVVGFAGPRGDLFEPITTDGESDDFELVAKRKAEDGMVLPGKKARLS